jgi:hypothetical protein
MSLERATAAIGLRPRRTLIAIAWLLCSCSTAGTALEEAGSPDVEAGLSDGGGIDVTLDVAGGAPDASTEAASPDGASTDALGPPTLTVLTVSTGSLVPAFDAGVTDYAMTSLNSVYPIQVTATASDPQASLVIHNAPAQSGVAASFKLAAGEDFTVSLASGPVYTVHYLPPDWPAYTITTGPDGGPEAGTEDVLMTTLSYQLIVDHSGAPLYYRTFAPSIVFDFQPFTLPDGGLAYATGVGASAADTWLDGVQHVMDSQFRDVADLQLPARGNHGILPAEAHDFILLDTDHYVAESYVEQTVDLSGMNPAWSAQSLVANVVVEEVVSGAVVFEWDSANYPSFYADSTYDNAFQTGVVSDYLHFNSMCIDPADGNFIFSFRNTSSIVKVDRTTGAILWTLGGKEDEFGLTGQQVFAYQHYVRAEADGSLWVFDNDSAPPARILSFVLDEANKKVVSFTDVYDQPPSQPWAELMGSYAKLGAGRYLFGWGEWITGEVAPATTEVSNGTVVWGLTFTSGETFTYRALPIPGL